MHNTICNWKSLYNICGYPIHVFFLVFPLFKCTYIKIHIVKDLLFSPAWHRDIYYTQLHDETMDLYLYQGRPYISYIYRISWCYLLIYKCFVYVFLVHLLNCVFHFKIVFIHVHLCTKTLVTMIFTCTYMYMYMYMYIQDQEHSHEFTWQFTRELNFTKIYVKKVYARFKRISMWNFRVFFFMKHWSQKWLCIFLYFPIC